MLAKYYCQYNYKPSNSKKWHTEQDWFCWFRLNLAPSLPLKDHNSFTHFRILPARNPYELFLLTTFKAKQNSSLCQCVHMVLSPFYPRINSIAANLGSYKLSSGICLGQEPLGIYSQSINFPFEWAEVHFHLSRWAKYDIGDLLFWPPNSRTQDLLFWSPTLEPIY